MFHRVLVPLDGSARAERALPLAVRLASASGGSLLLVRIVTESFYAPATLGYGYNYADGLTVSADEAEAYLKGVMARADLAGVPVTTVASIGAPAAAIGEIARGHHADIIVMCSHGRTGLAKWAMGSVAQKVARHSAVPVLVLKEGVPDPAAAAAGQGSGPRILIPLDGSPLAETAIAPALALLARLGAGGSVGIHLLRAVDLTMLYGRVGVDGARDQTVRTAITENAHKYLTAMADQVRQQVRETLPNARVTWSVATGIDPAAIITETAAGHGAHITDEQATPYDVIALATHGRGGFGVWAVGSVTERVLTTASSPVLIVRPACVPEHTDEPNIASVEPWTTPLL